MSRKPPTITVQYLKGDGSLHLEWDLDRFFPDPEDPDEVWIELPAGPVTGPMDGREVREIDLPASTVQPYAGTVLGGSVVFKWTGPPDDVQGSAFAIALPGGGSPAPPAQVPFVPQLQVLAREPKTLRNENRITIGWASYSYNKGNIFWGPADQPRLHTHNIDPHGAKYSGTFTTDRPLRPRTAYRFTVQVTNGFEHRTVEAEITATSAANHISVRQFLRESGVPTPTGLRGALRGARSLRASMG
ncbi:hypothetical protein OG625_40895 (plasmid) [Streptomyces sp. NBC_01351]|uniref:hypothetical protein n=1 Tax=Streptomyces sp. NBC_01351 TaxID=2903833 RepID=UPI002E30E809|nr:hypothetical protein [Streptomyces sp. NBC_01351]